MPPINRLVRAASLLALVSKRLQEDGDVFFQEIDLSAAQLAIMRSLWERDGLTLGELSCCCCCAPPNVTGLVDRLEKKGLVKRCATPEDRRVTRVQLTEAGRTLAKPAERVGRKHLSTLAEALRPDELDALVQLLEKIYRRQTGEAAEAVLAALGGTEGSRNRPGAL